jgi:hypothetical protein
MKRKSHPQARRSTTKSVLRLPDLELAKAAVLNSLTSRTLKGDIGTPSMSSLSGIVQPRLAFNGLWSFGIAHTWNLVS